MNALDLFYLPAAIATAPWWARKARGGWRERFGHTAPIPSTQAGRRLLLHAVSVGEVNTLRGLVPLLRDAGVEVVVSSTTDTGLARARALFAESALADNLPGRPGVRVVRYALDFSAAVRRLLDAVEPDAVALVELEVWPNFVAECRRRDVPVCVINGRLSERSFRGYHRFKRFVGPSFGGLAFVGAQDAAYAARFREMGVRDVRVTGSMKWDAVTPLAPGQALPGADKLAAELGIDRSRPLIVAGSTGPGPRAGTPSEERLLHEACPPGVQLLCAPRKPERFSEAFVALGGRARCTRRSEGRAANEVSVGTGGAGARSSSGVTRSDTGSAPPPPPPLDRFLLDSIGELRLAYSLADVAVVGRSFTNLRGSDPIEPIALGKPTVIGPDFANFTSIVEAFVREKAIVMCDAKSLRGEVETLLNDSAKRETLAAAGRRCIAANQGATARHAGMLCELLKLPLHAVEGSGSTASVASGMPEFAGVRA